MRSGFWSRASPAMDSYGLHPRTIELVAFPTRYTHSPFETVHKGDLIQTVELLRKFLEGELIV